MHAWVGKAIMALLAWSSPWYWVVLAVALATVGLLHPVPWTLKDDEDSFVAHLVLWVRKAAAYTALWGILAIPLLVYCSFVLSADTSSGQASSVFLEWGADRLGRYWMMVAGAFVVGLALRFLWDRYAVPVLSKYWRSLRIEQETDTS
ncbi:MAG: conjugal transfer protein TraC, partial [Ralstonia sp.]